MKTLAMFLLMLSIPNVQTVLPARTPSTKTEASHKGGQWYLADNGHAVYCYGPVRVVTDRNGNLQRVATFCKGDHTIVPLRD
jgi:hypothetical protein